MFKKIFFLLSLCLFIFIILKLFFFIRQGSWDGKNRFNLLFKGRSTSYLASLVPAEGEVVWQILAGGEAPAVFIDAVFEVRNYCFSSEETIKSCFLGQFYSRFKTWDNWRFWWYLRGVTPVKIIKVEKVGNFFRDEALIRDDLSLVIMNTTGHFGLAAKIGQLITNSGGQVVRLADETSHLSGCQIKTERRLITSYTVKKLKNWLHCQLLVGSVENERARVVIRLGEQNWVDF